MTAEQLRAEAARFQDTIVSDRRFLHTHPGTGFDIKETVDYVKKELSEMGYEPMECGRAGIVAIAGGKNEGRLFLIRGDMDALPVRE